MDSSGVLLSLVCLAMVSKCSAEHTERLPLDDVKNHRIPFIGDFQGHLPLKASNDDREDRDHETESDLLDEDIHCCARKSKFQSVGLDMQGRDHIMDVGECQKSRDHHDERNRRHRHHHLGSVQSTDDMDGKKAFGSVTTSNENCSSENLCEVALTSLRRFYSPGGPVDIPVTQKCHSVPVPPYCSRAENVIEFFGDSRFSRILDVGKCLGNCTANDSECKPAVNRTVSVEGPNGAICVPVVEECSCSPSCYRMQFLDSFHQKVWNDVLNTTEHKVLEIDIGRCVGACNHERNFHCVWRDSENPEKCLMSLKQAPEKCIPVEFKAHTFEEISSKMRTVLSIERCGCQE